LHFNSRAAYQKLYEYFGLNPNNKDSIIMNIEIQDFLSEIGVQIDATETAEKLWKFYNKYMRDLKKNEQEIERDVSYSPVNFDNIFIDNDYIAKIIRILKRKKAIILKGVPGVGKTFVIRDLLSKSFANIGDEGIEMIQFHQTYAYEECIEGLTPQKIGRASCREGEWKRREGGSHKEENT